MKDAADAIVVGGGVNGLVAACLLARSGRRVTVLEARDCVGGLAAREPFHRGFCAPGVLQETAGFREAVVRALDLGRHGLRRRPAPPSTWCPGGDGDAGGVWIRGDVLEGDVAPNDHGRHAQLMALAGRLGAALRPLLDAPAPDPQGPLPPLIGAAWNLRRLGADDLLRLTRIAPASVADWLRDSLDTERLRAAVAQPALLGSWMGPWSAGSAANLLLHLCQDDGEVEGGPAAVVTALTRAAEALGVQIRTRAPVERIRVRAGRVEAAVLPGGDEVAAGLVVSALDPRRTLLDLVGAAWLPAELARDLSHWRCRGVTSAVRLALSAPMTTPAGEPVESLRLGASLDALERSFDTAKHGSPFTEPAALVARQPTLGEPGLAPSQGQHVVTVLVHGTPFDVQVEGGWSDPLREALGDAVVAALGRHCPDLEAHVVGRQVLTPEDLHRRYGLTGGHLFHGEHAPDQLLFLRPHHALSRHATPVAGLWLCGAGTHPGGGITGAPALLAVDAIARGGRE